MNHQRYPSDVVKEAHSVSLKVLRWPVTPVSCGPISTQGVSETLRPATAGEGSTPASLAYGSGGVPNPEPFILSPILNLPPSFGSAYVGETFSCTLCANNDVSAEDPSHSRAASDKKKLVRDVRIEAEMKTPGSAGATSVVKLNLGPDHEGWASKEGIDLQDGQSLQKIVNFDLKEEGNHVLAVTVSYYEATDTSGRTRTFRKLYQFICKPSLIVRTKASVVPSAKSSPARRWVLEAQLENCSEEAILLERVVLEAEEGIVYADCNWYASRSSRPILHPSEVEQVCFVVSVGGSPSKTLRDKVVFGTLGIGWRAEMGNRGFLSTGKLGTRFTA